MTDPPPAWPERMRTLDPDATLPDGVVVDLDSSVQLYEEDLEEIWPTS